jgi:putative restriction endonuclease
MRWRGWLPTAKTESLDEVMSIEHYKTKFAKLRMDAKPKWPDATFNRVPYKPFLLLSIMDLMAQNVIDVNLIRLNADLMDAFDLYWTRIVGNQRDSNPAMPFNHLQSEGFWHLVDVHGTVQNLKHIDRNEIFRRIKNQEILAQFDIELFALLQDPESRDSLRRVIIEEYFTPKARPVIVEVSRITIESFEYSRELLNRSRGRFTLDDSPDFDEIYDAEVRSAAFRRVIVDAYNHTCAVCRVRLVTPEGRTCVAAGHIVPWRYRHNDDPRNGMALCGFHHWTFDQGLIGVDTDYTIRLSPVLEMAEQRAGVLMDLAGQTIHKPDTRRLWPARKALEWHMKRIFRPVKPEISL